MNKQMKSLYVAIVENRVVLAESNLKDFSKELIKIESEAKSYDHYYRKFKESDIVQLVSSKDKLYILQKVL